MGVDTLLKMVSSTNVKASLDLRLPWHIFKALHHFCQPSSPTSPLQVFVDNFVHGDLHPGNILVQYPKSLAGSSDTVGATGGHHGKTTLTDLLDTVVVSVRPDPCPLQLVLLDAGIVAQLSDHDLANFKAVFTAVVLRKVLGTLTVIQ